jgi:hypothetical protein
MGSRDTNLVKYSMHPWIQKNNFNFSFDFLAFIFIFSICLLSLFIQFRSTCRSASAVHVQCESTRSSEQNVCSTQIHNCRDHDRTRPLRASNKKLSNEIECSTCEPASVPRTSYPFSTSISTSTLFRSNCRPNNLIKLRRERANNEQWKVEH